MAGKIAVFNVNQPGKSNNVDATKYEAMKLAVLATLPAGEPGLTIADASKAAKAGLPEEVFPGGATAGWWFKCVQLDLEARGMIQRSANSPIHLWQSKSGNGGEKS